LRDARPVLEKTSTDIELQGLWSVNDLGGNQRRTPREKDIWHVVQRTKQGLVIFPRTYPLTHQASELSLAIVDCGYRNWTLSSLRITFEDKLEIVRMLGT
jgi:hypothetical protein